MEMGKIIMEAIKEKVQGESLIRQLEEINTEITRFDFGIATSMADTKRWSEYVMIQANAKKIEAAYKGYIYGIVADDK